MAKRRKKKSGFLTKIKRLIFVSTVIILGILVFLYVSLNGLVKKGLEKYGPEATQCSVEVGAVRLIPYMGIGSISDLTVGNPEGYDTPTAIHIKKASIALEPSSLMEEKIIIRKIQFIAPEITFEGSTKKNNLTTIVDNINDYVEKIGLAKDDDTVEKPTPLQIDDLLITNATVKLELPIFKGKTVDLKLKDIHLKDLGQGPEGITGGEVASQALGVIIRQTTLAIPKKIAELGLKGLDGIKDGVGGLFNKLKGE